MTPKHSTKELDGMTLEDLRREVTDKKGVVAKMRLGLALGSEKDNARYARERKEVARLLTALSRKEKAEPKQKETTALKKKKKGSTLSAPATV